MAKSKKKPSKQSKPGEKPIRNRFVDTSLEFVTIKPPKESNKGKGKGK